MRAQGLGPAPPLSGAAHVPAPGATMAARENAKAGVRDLGCQKTGSSHAFTHESRLWQYEALGARRPSPRHGYATKTPPLLALL